MATMRRTRSPDATFGLWREGYTFVGNRCRELGTDVFATRLMLRPTICMLGEDAARLFYDEQRFTRAGAAPARLQQTLIGRGGVQGLDGEHHRHRKRMFLDLMGPEALRGLAETSRTEWDAAAARWQRRDEVVLFDEVTRLLCRTACTWAGVPLPENEVDVRTHDLAAMIDGGGIGLRYLLGVRGRARAERWARGLIHRARAGDLPSGADRALGVIASHRDLTGVRLSEQVAAVELLNVIRPTVAVARYVVFAALALQRHPEVRLFLNADPRHLRPFVQEVRRFYPFFPFATARVRETFLWRGLPFPRGTQVLLDLYGTNHDPRRWVEPDVFRPQRFVGKDGSPFGFVPQGGGQHGRHHRCAGEWATIVLMEVAVDFLIRRLTYAVPTQDLEIPFSRMPALPRSGFVVQRVRRRPTFGEVFAPGIAPAG